MGRPRPTPRATRPPRFRWRRRRRNKTWERQLYTIHYREKKYAAGALVVKACPPNAAIFLRGPGARGIHTFTSATSKLASRKKSRRQRVATATSNDGAVKDK